MDLQQYFKAIRKSWWLVLGCLMLGIGITSALLVQQTPMYQSSVTFFVNTSASGGSSLYQNDQYAQQRVTSYVELMSSERLAKMIVGDSRVDISATSVMHEISAKSQLNTVLLTADVTDGSPERSLQIADSLSKQFVRLVRIIDPSVRIEVTSGPILDPVPVSPRTKLDLAVGSLAGLVVGLAVAVIRELFDTTIRTADSLREISGAPLLGQIGYERAAQKLPLITDTHSRSVRAEAFRMLRTNLQFVDSESRVQVIAVTSSTAGEGKSTTSANLAMIFAETGQRVLLIEADLRRPRVSDYLGLERAAGLTNVLAKQTAIDDVMQPWGRGGLTVLSSGPIPPNPSELLGSNAMVELLDALRQQFDLIVLDTPPLSLVTDAAVVAVHADGAIVVVRAGKTRRQQLLDALQSLRAVDMRVLGCVLNMARMRSTDAYLAYDVYAAHEPEPVVAESGEGAGPPRVDAQRPGESDRTMAGESVDEAAGTIEPREPVIADPDFSGGDGAGRDRDDDHGDVRSTEGPAEYRLKGGPSSVIRSEAGAGSGRFRLIEPGSARQVHVAYPRD